MQFRTEHLLCRYVSKIHNFPKQKVSRIVKYGKKLLSIRNLVNHNYVISSLALHIVFNLFKKSVKF